MHSLSGLYLCKCVFFFCHQDYTEDYIQTGPGQLYALSTRMFSVDKVSVPYSWNHTILYEPSRGKMPYLVQTLHASSISAQYRPLEEMLEFTIYASISKGEAHLLRFHEYSCRQPLLCN